MWCSAGSCVFFHGCVTMPNPHGKGPTTYKFCMAAYKKRMCRKQHRVGTCIFHFDPFCSHPLPTRQTPRPLKNPMAAIVKNGARWQIRLRPCFAAPATFWHDTLPTRRVYRSRKNPTVTVTKKRVRCQGCCASTPPLGGHTPY